MSISKVIHIRVHNSDEDITDMDYDELNEFICSMLDNETGKWGLEFEPLPEKTYLHSNDVKETLYKLKDEYYNKKFVQNSIIQSEGYVGEIAIGKVLQELISGD